MNVLIAADYATPASGNFIGSMMDLGIKMRKQNAQLLFVFPENKNTTGESSWVRWLETCGFQVFLLNKTLPDADQLAFLMHIIREHQIDILHIHFGLFHNVALHNHSKLPVKIIVHEHMEYPAGCNHRKQTLRFMARSLLYRVRRIGVISVNKDVDRAYGLARHWYVPNALSLKRNVRESTPRDERRAQLGFQQDDRVVLFLGWDLYRKGLDIAVKAVSKCREQDPTVRLAIVGLGELPSHEQKSFIQNAAGISPDEPWIRYLPSTEDMFSYLRAADVYLSASRSEAFSYGLLEAISQDTPIAVSDIKGAHWSAQYSRSFFYPVESPESCAAAITDALERGKQIPSNYKEVIKRYNIDQWAEKITQIYSII